MIVADNPRSARLAAVKANAQNDVIQQFDEFRDEHNEFVYIVESVVLVTDLSELETLRKYFNVYDTEKCVEFNEIFVCVGRVCDRDDEFFVVRAPNKEEAQSKFEEDIQNMEMDWDSEVYTEYCYSLEEIIAQAFAMQ